ncbi:MAG: transcriptional repressor [Lachnospiraceae bacterium]|nr:transcriptional repressor [Lachnospiraceae bacterium]
MSVEAKKGFIIQELKKSGCRITTQRQLLIDIILKDECSCCKEIYYRAAKKDPSIGMATVYRMVKTLEEAGLIQRKNMYRIDCEAVATA